MTEREHRERFTQHMADLIHHINATPGYSCTGGDLFRDKRVHGEWGKKESYSAAKSMHKRGMAIDLNLYLDGVYLTETSDHHQFGMYWEALDLKNRWGGRYGDGNHYERLPQGWR